MVRRRQPITLAYLVADDDSTVVALRGGPGVPGWQVIGHYAQEYEAGKALPTPVPPGVLRADVSRFNRPAPAPEVSLQDLIRDVVEGHSAGDASNALLGAVQRRYDASPMARLQDPLETSSQFASALETVQGRQIAARLTALSRQIEFLTREVEEAAEDLGATVAVLPTASAVCWHWTAAPEQRSGAPPRWTPLETKRRTTRRECCSSRTRSWRWPATRPSPGARADPPDRPRRSPRAGPERPTRHRAVAALNIRYVRSPWRDPGSASPPVAAAVRYAAVDRAFYDR